MFFTQDSGSSRFSFFFFYFLFPLLFPFTGAAISRMMDGRVARFDHGRAWSMEQWKTAHSRTTLDLTDGGASLHISATGFVGCI